MGEQHFKSVGVHMDQDLVLRHIHRMPEELDLPHIRLLEIC